LLETYSVPDPLTTDSVGVFPDRNFNFCMSIYSAGNHLLNEALLVGKAIEELDIADLTFSINFC